MLLVPLWQRVETDLRLDHHAALLTGVPPLNPVTGNVLDVTPLLEMDSMQLAAQSVDVRQAGPTIALQLSLDALLPGMLCCECHVLSDDRTVMT